MGSGRRVSVAEHLCELRNRIAWYLLVLLGGAALGYLFRGGVIAFLERPLGSQLFYTSPTGGFEFTIRICLVVGFLLSLPVACYNVIRFIEPALERFFKPSAMALLIVASLGLALGGAGFGYYISLPAALHFFNQVGGSNLHALITADQYFTFLMGYLVTFALIFQLPLVLLLINHVTPFGPGGIGKWRMYVIIGAFGLAVLLPSAPDPLSQVILALPIIGLYELSNLLLWGINRKRRVPTTPSTEVPAPIVAPPRRTAARSAPRPQRLVMDAVRPAATPTARPAQKAHSTSRPVPPRRAVFNDILDLRLQS